MFNQITNIYDNENATFDRFTICFKDTDMMLGLSSNCNSPNGFGQFTQGNEGTHLGKKIEFVDLPLNVQKYVKMRLA